MFVLFSGLGITTNFTFQVAVSGVTLIKREENGNNF